jgi:atypical dual specificity phosphatase
MISQRVSGWFETYGFAEVHDDLVIGAYPLDILDIDALASFGVQRVLNLVEDEEYEPGTRALVEAGYAELGIVEERIPTVDFGSLTPEFLDAAVGVVLGWMDEGQVSYVHCRAGRQRSAAVAAGAVAAYERIDIRSALDYVRSRKASADPLPQQRDDLIDWWQARALGWSA